MLVSALSQESEDTALTIAASRGHAEVVRLLLQHRANVKHRVCAGDIRICELCTPASSSEVPWVAGQVRVDRLTLGDRHIFECLHDSFVVRARVQFFSRRGTFSSVGLWCRS